LSRSFLVTLRRIVPMLGVVGLGVPDARVGLVTSRARGPSEDYLVREVPLDVDYWRATNFVQFVSAEGGSDRPEDVRAGLQAAFRQHWRPAARRVVVLAGDAPPHRKDVGPMLDAVRAFAGNGRSFVHTLVTSPERAGDDTRDYFEEIATSGRGVCEPLSRHDRVLQRVLTFAFGREFDRDIDAVVRAADEQRNAVDVRSLHLARTGGDALERHTRCSDGNLYL
jgi:hypothetical protein